MSLHTHKMLGELYLQTCGKSEQKFDFRTMRHCLARNFTIVPNTATDYIQTIAQKQTTVNEIHNKQTQHSQ